MKKCNKHEWAHDNAKGIIWCKNCDAAITFELLKAMNVPILPSMLDEIIDRPIVSEIK